MFTGIVKGLGTIVDVKKRDAFLDIVVDVGGVLANAEVGASVAVDGVCLTVTSVTAPLDPPMAGGRPELRFTFSVMGETLTKTTVGDLKAGDKVCLEQPLKMGEEFGGHIVLGHVDGMGMIVEKKIDGENCWITIEAPDLFVKYIVQKGSIAIDGVSLTICDPAIIAGGIRFAVSLLPLTLERTTLGLKGVGAKVNLEADYFLKAMVR